MTAIDWALAWDSLPLLLKAAAVTVEATVVGFTLAAVFGLFLAILRRSRRKIVSWPVAGFVEFVRSTPLLVQLYVVYFVFPEFGVTLTALTTGILGLGLHYSAYTSEVYRAGLDGVPKEQWDAAAALSLSPYRTYRDVVIPQTIPPVVPALGNYLIGMFKETPMLSAIAVVELMQQAKIIGSETFRYVEPITMVGLFFLALSLVAAAGVRRVEARLSPVRRLSMQEHTP